MFPIAAKPQNKAEMIRLAKAKDPALTPEQLAAKLSVPPVQVREALRSKACRLSEGSLLDVKKEGWSIKLYCQGNCTHSWSPSWDQIIQGPRARPRRRGLPKDAGQRHAVSPNILDRAFVASAPNQKWIADFTYIWTAQGWLYVAAVVDLYSRLVVGWSMSSSMAAQLVTDALIMAIWRRGKPDSLLHHSDQTSQYTSEQFQRLMADHGMTCSMSRSGNVWDNAGMESFFPSLKTERTARMVYRNRDDARADVFDYIERFYNPRRRHSTLGYLSPVQYEEQVKLA
jgi:putative transposase